MGTVLDFRPRSAMQQGQQAIDDGVWLCLMLGFASCVYFEALCALTAEGFADAMQANRP